MRMIIRDLFSLRESDPGNSLFGMIVSPVGIGG